MPKKTPTTQLLTNISPELYEAIAKDKGSRFPTVNKNDVILEALNSFYGLEAEKMNPTTKNEVLELPENARKMKYSDIPEIPQEGTEENPFMCNMSIARNMKRIYDCDFWVCIPVGCGMKICQLKDVE